MLQMFRNFFRSKVGIIVTLGFLGLIALAFASGDVANSSLFGGVSGGDRVAVVGDTKVSTSDLQRLTNSALDSARQQNPTITMQAFVEQGAVEEVLSQYLDRLALSEFAQAHGLRAGENVVNSEILQIPSFLGPDGNFDQQTYQMALQQRGLNDSILREDLAQTLLVQQVLAPIDRGARIPEKIGRRYAQLLRERRKGAVALITSAAYAPEDDPTDEQLQAYYQTAQARYIRPERRVIRYATFGQEALDDLPAPTDAQIRARYERDKAQYAPSETRSFTQVVAATQEAAKALADAAKGGTSLAAAAQQRGLATSTIGPMSKQELSDAASVAVANAAFAAESGSVVAPTRGGLGWYVLRVDSIDRDPGKTLDQAHDEIADMLAVEQRREALLNLGERIEEELDDGANLSQIADELGFKLTESKPLTADGRVYGSSEMGPRELVSALSTAFAMDVEEPQLAEIVPGETFLVFEVSDITESAAAPLAEIHDDVVAAWRRSEGSNAAKEAAQRVLARVQDGKTLAAALGEEEKRSPPPQQIDLNREQLAQLQQVPPYLALMFSMAEGTVKRLEGPNDAGWFIVQLDDIETDALEDGDPLIASTQRQVAQLAGNEYIAQFVAAVKAGIGIKRNQPAIDAVRAALTGNTPN